MNHIWLYKLVFFMLIIRTRPFFFAGAVVEVGAGIFQNLCRKGKKWAAPVTLGGTMGSDPNHIFFKCGIAVVRLI